MVTFEARQFHGEAWTPAQQRRLVKLLARGISLELAALKLGRTPSAVKKKAIELRRASVRAARRGAPAKSGSR